MNLNTLIDRCEARIRDEANDVVSTEQWTEYINDSYSQANSASPRWPVFVARAQPLVVPAGVEGVELPEDVWVVNSVYNEVAKYTLAPVHGYTTARDFYAAGSTGEPHVYRVAGNFLEVYPAPTGDTTLTVEWIEGPADLASGTDEPWFPERWHRMLVDGALALFYEDDGNQGVAGMHQSRFSAYLASMREALIGTQTGEYHVIQDAWYD